MPLATFASTLSLGGVTITAPTSRSGDHPNVYAGITLPAGKPGTLTGRTDGDTGVATLGAGHSLVTSDVVDVYWAGGRRYGMTATVSGNDVTLDGGSGDNLPSTSTAVVVTKPVVINTEIDGDAIQIIGILASTSDTTLNSKLQLTFQDSGGAVVAHVDLAANQQLVYDIAGGQANPFSGNPITVCYASNGDSANAATLNILSLEDSTP